LFNYNEFLFDGQTDKKKFLTAEEINKGDFGVNVEKILKIFTNWGCTNSTIDNNFGEIIALIKNSEIQNGIIPKSSFERIFFINKIIDSTNKILFPDFFYNFDFHNINMFLSHFIMNNENDNKIETKKEYKVEVEKMEKENIKEDNEKDETKNYQELIHSNDILSILILICFDVISETEVEIIKMKNENKLIKNKYITKEDFINIKFSFEEKISKAFKNYNELIVKFKLFLFEINENKNGLLHFINFTDLISLKSLKFENESDKKKIKYYFDLFYH